MDKSSWYKDSQFWAALSAAPVVWGGLYWLDTPQITFWWVEAPLTFLMLSLVRPLLEEIVFRGMVQGWFIEQTWGKRGVEGITMANILAGIIFATLHAVSHSPLMGALVFIPSLVFGYFRDRYDGWLIPSVILHCFYNMGYFILYSPLF